MGRRSVTVFDRESEPLERRIATGLHKLGLAMKHEAWSRASADGLSPTQGHILSMLVNEGPLRASEVAAKLGVTPPTVADAVSTLVDKGMLEKRPDPSHGRALLLHPTAQGRTLARRVATWPDFLATACEALRADEQAVFLTGVVAMIRALQADGRIAQARMCMGCRYFQPHVHEGALPHHCAYVDAPMSASHLRVECAEHEPAATADADAQWQRFRDPG